MDNFHRLHNQVAGRLFVGLLSSSLVTVGAAWVGLYVLKLSPLQALALCLVIATSISILVSSKLAATTLSPLKAIWQAIIHVDPNHHGTTPPNLEKLRLGRELVTNLALQVYQFASLQKADDTNAAEHRREIIQAANIVSHLPLPMFVFNKELLVVNASNAAMEYCKVDSSALFGKPIFDSLDLEYPSEYTLEKWIEECQKDKVTNTGYWERVRVRVKGEENAGIRQCDVSAYFNRDNTSGTEYIVTLFDRTDQYNQEDESMGFVALAVHELRTPLTILKGYVEVLEDELADKLDDELKASVLKLSDAANQLSGFVHTILSVERIQNNQMSLHLNEENWEEVLAKNLQDMYLRAKVHQVELEVTIAKGLLKVGVDRVAIYEVTTNLIENAIKYSGDSKRIVIDSHMNGDVVETTVQDFGVGISESVLPNIFEKFYRNHRTKTQVGGTGLGLYLSKAIITAHGGQVWAKSKEGQGSTFGFTLLPYDKLDQAGKQGSDEIVRQANGWIKNHSYYRR